MYVLHWDLHASSSGTPVVKGFNNLNAFVNLCVSLNEFDPVLWAGLCHITLKPQFYNIL